VFVCPICEVENRADAKFCRKCGQSRSALEQHLAVTANVRAGSAVEVSAEAVAPATVSTKSSNRTADQLAQVTDKTMVESATPSQHLADSGLVSPEVLPENRGQIIASVQQNNSLTPSEVHPASAMIGETSNKQSAPPAVQPSPAFSEQQQVAFTVSTAAPVPDFSMPQCPACWTALRASDKYCCWCGEPQPLRAAPYMKICVECNTQLPEKANFCHACGSDVSGRFKNKVRFPVELFTEEDSEFFPRFDA
jgi:ribosomal protein L40E